MEFRVLGPLQVVDGDRAVVITSPRQRALLGLLLVHAGRSVSTDRILDEVWGDEAPGSGREAVAFHVARLRRTLAHGDGGAGAPIETRDGGYVLRVDPDDIDAVRFERLAAEGHAQRSTDPAAAGAALSRALALWRGDPYEELTDLPFTADEVRRLEELRLRVSEDRLETELTLGHDAAAATELESLVDREPLRERVRGLLMIALYRCGRQADALRAYRDGRRLLADELGIDPAPELVAVEAAILRQDPALLSGPPLRAVEESDAPARSSSPIRNPYKGLRAFGEADAADFYGREALTTRLVERLGEVARTTGLLAVVGPSGSGKSSIVRAGVVPALRAGALEGSATWPIVTMFPGSRPLEELAAALRSVRAAGQRRLKSADEPTNDPAATVRESLQRLPADARLVLVIDQLEELYTLAADDNTAEPFSRMVADVLAASAGRLLVIVTLRADHFDATLRSADLGPLLRAGTELVPPLDRAGLQRAIERPAAGAGLRLEPGLADAVVAEVVDRPAMLPLLQYAMTELVERAGERTLTRAGYQAISGVLGALAGRAEATFASLEPDGRDAARQVLLQLVAVGSSGEAGARRVPRSVIDVDPRSTEVLERFGQARLLSHGRDARSGEATVEVAHEALLARWPRLAAWIEEERESMWLLRRLAEAADEWVEHDRDDGFLLTGGRLEMFASWSAVTDLHLGPADRALLDASLAERDRAAKAESARQARESRLEHVATRWLRALVAVFALAAVLSTGLLAAVWSQSEAAAEERAIATARQLAVAAHGQLDGPPGLALLLALESARATADRGWITEETMDALHWAIQEGRIAYPIDEGPVGIRMARDGARGVYLLPADELVKLAEAAVWWREINPDECRTYLGREDCSDIGAVPTDGLMGVMTADGMVGMERFASAGTARPSVKVWSQLPLDPLELLAGFHRRTGTTVVLSPDDAATGLATTISRSDLAIMARPGDVAELTRPGFAVDLRTILQPDEATVIAGSPLAELGWVGAHAFGHDTDGARLVGSPIAVTASSLLWYPADAFTVSGYTVPQTWQELEQLERTLMADGRTPWCIGLADGAAGPDWIEDLAIASGSGGASGSSADPVWLRFDGPAVESAFTRFRRLVSTEGALLGGRDSILHSSNETAAARMGGGSEPSCWLIHATNAEVDSWASGVRADLRPIAMPIGGAPSALRGRVYTLMVLHDRPEVRALVRELLGTDVASWLSSGSGVEILPLGPSGQTAWASASGDVRAALVSALRAGRFWVDGSDLLPRDIGEIAFRDAVIRVAQADDEKASGLIDRELAALARLVSEAEP